MAFTLLSTVTTPKLKWQWINNYWSKQPCEGGQVRQQLDRARIIRIITVPCMRDEVCLYLARVGAISICINPASEKSTDHYRCLVNYFNKMLWDGSPQSLPPAPCHPFPNSAHLTHTHPNKPMKRSEKGNRHASQPIHALGGGGWIIRASVCNQSADSASGWSWRSWSKYCPLVLQPFSCSSVVQLTSYPSTTTAQLYPN